MRKPRLTPEALAASYAARAARIRATMQAPAFREAMAAKSRALHQARPEIGQILGAQTAARWADPDIRARLIARLKEHNGTDEHRAMLAERLKRQWADPAHREKRRLNALRKKGMAVPEPSPPPPSPQEPPAMPAGRPPPTAEELFAKTGIEIPGWVIRAGLRATFIDACLAEGGSEEDAAAWCRRIKREAA